MSAMIKIHSWKSLAQHAGRLRYIDFLVKLTPAISMAFIIYVVFKDVLW